MLKRKEGFDLAEVCASFRVHPPEGLRTPVGNQQRERIVFIPFPVKKNIYRRAFIILRDMCVLRLFFADPSPLPTIQ